MVFSSLEFLCVFLPVIVALYYIVPGIKGKNAILLIASLLFYAYGEPVYVFLMLASALLNYAVALGIDKCKGYKKAIFIIGVVVNLGVLVVFKYTDFLIQTCNNLTGSDISLPDIALPIGISFFTFQALSYVIDVYNGKVTAQTSYAKLLLYISFFPQLIAGPIVKYSDICKQLENRKMDVQSIACGLRRFICGLGKKVIFANTAAVVADAVYNAQNVQMNIAVAWLGTIAYLLQIYFDFSGYSDMAIGLGRMFGFQFKENFHYPYAADGIQDFWRRWHISLSTWFKEYLYIPLGGNRKGTLCTCRNRMIVFFLTGLWHGANWTFVIWGLWHGVFLLFETYLPIIKKLPKMIRRIYTLLVVIVGFVFFRADTIQEGCFVIKQMFAGFTFSAESISFAWQQLTIWNVCILSLGFIGAVWMSAILEKIRVQVNQPVVAGVWKMVQGVLYVLSMFLLAWCILRLSADTYNPFIYFRF